MCIWYWLATQGRRRSFKLNSHISLEEAHEQMFHGLFIMDERFFADFDEWNLQRSATSWIRTIRPVVNPDEDGGGIGKRRKDQKFLPFIWIFNDIDSHWLCHACLHIEGIMQWLPLLWLASHLNAVISEVGLSLVSFLSFFDVLRFLDDVTHMSSWDSYLLSSLFSLYGRFP